MTDLSKIIEQLDEIVVKGEVPVICKPCQLGADGSYQEFHGKCEGDCPCHHEKAGDPRVIKVANSKVSDSE